MTSLRRPGTALALWTSVTEILQLTCRPASNDLATVSSLLAGRQVSLIAGHTDRSQPCDRPSDRPATSSEDTPWRPRRSGTPRSRPCGEDCSPPPTTRSPTACWPTCWPRRRRSRVGGRGRHPGADPGGRPGPVHRAGVRGDLAAGDRRAARRHQGGALLPLQEQGRDRRELRRPTGWR